jgi:hypothetical protein
MTRISKVRLIRCLRQTEVMKTQAAAKKKANNPLMLYKTISLTNDL